MPGLLRGIGRTAAIAGTATAVSNRVSRRQYNRWSEQQETQYAQAPEPAPAAPAQAAAPAATGTDDRIEQLKQLADLKAQGILTDQEFANEKAKILGS